MSTEIRFDPAAATDTENQLRSSAEEIQGHGDRLGSGTTGTVGRGSLGEVAENLVKKGIDVVVHGVTGVFAKLHTDTADGIKLVRERMLKAEADSSQASKDVESTLGGVFDRGGVTAHVGTGHYEGPSTDKIAELDNKPSNSRVTPKFLQGGGSIVEHEDGSVTYVTGPGHITNSSGNPTGVPVGTAVTYGPNGEPDFSGFLTHPSGVTHVTFSNGFKGNRTSDFSDSNNMAAMTATANGKPWTTIGALSPAGYTWHHANDGNTMFLVDRNIHDFFKHRGGVSILSSLGKRKR